MPKLLIFDAFTLLICEKTVAIYALLRCKTFSLKIWVCKFFDKFHVCIYFAAKWNRTVVTNLSGWLVGCECKKEIWLLELVLRLNPSPFSQPTLISIECRLSLCMRHVSCNPILQQASQLCLDIFVSVDLVRNKFNWGPCHLPPLSKN